MSPLLNGKRVIVSPYLTMVVSTVERRTWRERLFSRPWRPLKKTKVVSREVPSDQILLAGDNLVMHPSMLDRLRRSLVADAAGNILGVTEERR